MSIKPFFRLSLQSSNTLQADSYQSLVIALVRGLAALQVALAHLRAEIYPGLRGMSDAPVAYQLLAFSTGFAHQAVVMFFLISGWLVGGSLLNKWSQPHAIGAYAIDRVSRLWTVMVPTFLLMLLCAAFMERTLPTTSMMDSTNEYSALAFFGNLVGLQTIAVPNFGRNYALWSLANETWYYILFPLLLLVCRSKSGWRRIASTLAVAAIASFLPLSILLYFSLWLLGAAFSRIKISCGHPARIVLLCLCVILSIYYRLTGSNADLMTESYVQDLICSLPFMLLLASLHQPAPTGSSAMRHLKTTAQTLSEFSFTLYVSHVPAIVFLRYIAFTYFGRDKLSPHQALDYGIYVGSAVVLIATAYMLYRAFEANTFHVRRLLKKKLLSQSAARTRTATAPVK